jgi:2-polyprenyl-3-methyl-5-hydroxy-6-metoxy-1,4-benzoquinol methylase
VTTIRASFGTNKVTVVDRFGTWLSRRAILSAIGPATNLDVLELGCGYRAMNLLSVEDRAKSIVGVDFNVAPDIKSRPKFEILEQPIDLALAGLSSRRFDLILMISVLEHLWDATEALVNCRSMLKSGGMLVINVPTWVGKSLLELSAFRLHLSPAEEMEDHKMYYDKRDLWPLLVRAGFRPSCIFLRYHKFRLNLFAVARMG